MATKLLFVYNANNGAGSKMLDFAHKILSPATYDCKLCALTFGTFTEHGQWKAFRKALQAKGHQLSFLHKNKFQKSYKSKFGHAHTFPIILLETAYGLEVWVSTQTLNGMLTVQELITTVDALVSDL